MRPKILFISEFELAVPDIPKVGENIGE